MKIARRFGKMARKTDDFILVTGKIGGNIGLEDAKQGLATDAARHYLEPILPSRRISKLLSLYANAATDVSDGLLADLSDILRRSSRGGHLILDNIRLWRESSNLSDILAQCTGGDDYQIVCTASPKNAKLLIESELFYHIGHVVEDAQLTLIYQGARVNLPETLGFEHGG